MMHGLYHHSDALRLQDFLNRGCNFRCHALLDLEPLCIGVDNSGELRKPDHAALRNIGDPRLANLNTPDLLETPRGSA